MHHHLLTTLSTPLSPFWVFVQWIFSMSILPNGLRSNSKLGSRENRWIKVAFIFTKVEECTGLSDIFHFQRWANK